MLQTELTSNCAHNLV